MKRKFSVLILVLTLLFSVCFVGCNDDLSGLKSQLENMQQQIATMQQQITNLNQPISNLQNQLAQSEENQQQLLLDLTTARGKLATLEESFYGKENNYKAAGDTISYAVDGIKVFDLKLNEFIYDIPLTYHEISYTFTSYIEGVSELSDGKIDLNFMFYDKISSSTYETFNIAQDYIVFSRNIENDVREGIVYVYAGNTLISVFNAHFNEINYEIN